MKRACSLALPLIGGFLLARHFAHTCTNDESIRCAYVETREAIGEFYDEPAPRRACPDFAKFYEPVM